VVFLHSLAANHVGYGRRDNAVGSSLVGWQPSDPFNSRGAGRAGKTYRMSAGWTFRSGSMNAVEDCKTAGLHVEDILTIGGGLPISIGM
jgi:hypothetical protein